MNNTNTDQPWWQRILMGGAIAENPSVMTAAGHKIEKDGTVTVDNQNDAGVTQLRRSLPVIGSSAIMAVAATNPATYPWIAKNVVLPVLGGEVVNEATRKISNNYYNDFGDWLYRSTPLDNWTKGTLAETPTKFVVDMSNPGYWTPYGKIVNGFKNTVSTITKTYNKPVKINSTPRGALRYWANPNVESAAWKGGITKRYLSDIVLPNKIDSGIKYMTKNNDILKERLWKTYNRDLGISQYLEFFPPKQNGIVKDNTIMLIHGDPASTGVYTTASGIGRGTSTIHHYPTMNNGKLYPTKDVYHDYFGPVQNKIFWGENKPHGWSLTKSFNTFIDDLKHIDHKILSSTDKKVLYSHPSMTTSEIPYRFIFGDAKKLNGIERNTPNIALGTEWITNDVNLKDLNGLEWNPLLGVWEKHIYQSGGYPMNMSGAIFTSPDRVKSTLIDVK